MPLVPILPAEPARPTLAQPVPRPPVEELGDFPPVVVAVGSGRLLGRPRGAVGSLAVRYGTHPACSISPIPTTSSPAAAMRGAPKRSLKKRAPMAAPTMIEDSRRAATGARAARVCAQRTRA